MSNTFTRSMPAELAQIIDLHRSMFGGFQMKDDEAPANDAAQHGTEEPATDDTPTQTHDRTDWKAEARKWEDRAKANKDAADKLAQLEDANKTELQRATDAATKAQQEAEQARQELARERVARRHKLSDEDIELLTGDEEQMERLAARIAQSAGQQQTAEQNDTQGGRKAASVPGMGRVPETRNLSLDDQIAAAEKAGDKTLIASLKAMKLGSAAAAS